MDEEKPKEEKRDQKEEREKPPRPSSAAEAGTEPRKRYRPASVEPLVLGRGGPQHKYLQQLIKRLAEDKGYLAVIEKQILGGTGNVDVSLEKGDRKIACEISATSTSEQELGNVQKCLAAGYKHLILLSPEKKILTKAKGLVSAALGKEELWKVFPSCLRNFWPTWKL